MARFQITAPDGGTYEITAPDGATEQDALAHLQKTLAASKPQVGMGESFLRGAAQGATFNLSDELTGAAKAVAGRVTDGTPLGEGYDAALKQQRQANTAASEANPISYIGGEVAGGIGAALATRGALRGRGAVAPNPVAIGGSVGREVVPYAKRLWDAAKAGAGYGAAYGFGAAEGGEGSIGQQAFNRVSNSLVPALAGGVVGPALVPLADAAGAIAKGATQAVRASLDPKGTAQRKVAEALVRDMPEGTPVDDGIRRIQGRLTRAQEDKPAVLADVAGQNTRDLLRSATNMPNQGNEALRKTLDQRQGFQWSRIERDVADALGDGNRFAQTMDDVSKALSQHGSRAFGEAYAQPFNVKAGDPLARFLTERGYVQRMMEKTHESIQGMTGENVAQMKPWEFLHRVKMEIDREIARTKGGQQDPKASWTLRDLTQLKREMVDLMGQANPRFRSAMQSYGDMAGHRSALELGAEEFKRMSADEIREAMRGMASTTERKMFQLGAARSLFEDIERGNVTRDRTENLFSSPEIQKKLAAVIPDVARRRDLQRRLILEAKMADTRKAVQGGSTTARQLANADEAGQPMRTVAAVANASAGRFEPALAYLGRQVQRFSGLTPDVANEIIKQMMAKHPLGAEVGVMEAAARASKEPAFRDAIVREIMRSAQAAGSTAQRPEQRRQ